MQSTPADASQLFVSWLLMWRDYYPIKYAAMSSTPTWSKLNLSAVKSLGSHEILLIKTASKVDLGAKDGLPCWAVIVRK